jgi:hypothetical protein
MQSGSFENPGGTELELNQPRLDRHCFEILQSGEADGSWTVLREICFRPFSFMACC